MSGWETWIPGPGLFVAAIVAALALGLALLAREAVRARGEAAAVDRLRGNVDQARELGSRTLEDLDPVLRRDLSQDSAAGRRVAQLLEQRVGSPGAPRAASLAEVELARVQRGLALPRTLAAVLVLLGLCGAVGGLLKAVPDIGKILTEQSEIFSQGLDLKDRERAWTEKQRANPKEEALEAEQQRLAADTEEYRKRVQNASRRLGELSNELRPAFVASLSGILGTIVLSFALWLVESLQEKRVLTPLEELTATRLVPLLTPADDLGSLQDAVEILSSSQEYFSQLTDRLLGQFDQVSAQLGVLYAVVDQFRHAAQGLGEDRRALSEGHESMLESVRQFHSLAEEIHRNAGGAEARHMNLLAAMNRLVEPVEALGEELRSSRDQGARHLQETVNRLQQSLDVHLDRLGAALTEASQMRLSSSENRILSALEEMKSVLEWQAGSLESVGRVATGQEEALARFREVADRQVAALEGTRAAAEGAAKVQVGSASDLREALARLEQRLGELPKASAAAVEPLVAALREGAGVSASARESELRSAAAQLEAAARLLSTPRSSPSDSVSSVAGDARLLPLLEGLTSRLEAMERVQARSDGWNRASLLLIPATAVAAGAVLIAVLPPLTLGIAGAVAAVATGGAAWWMRRSLG